MCCTILAGSIRLLGLLLLATALLLWLDRYRADLVRKLALTGGASLMLGSVGGPITIVAALSTGFERPFLQLFAEYLYGTRSGLLTLAQLAAGLGVMASLLMLMLMLMLMRLSPGTRRVVLAAVATGLLLCVPLTMAAMGHAAESAAPILAVSIQALHISAGVAWCALAISVLPAHSDAIASRLLRVSDRALMAVLVMLITGFWAAWTNGLALGSLTTSGYGVLVMLKIGLLIPALLIAGWNRLAIRDIHFLGQAVNTRIRQMLLVECGFLIAILFAAVTLARSAPPH